MIYRTLFLLFSLFTLSLLTVSQSPSCSNDGPNKCEQGLTQKGKKDDGSNQSASLLDRVYPPPPKGDDRTFVLNDGPGLDTVCTGRGRLNISVPINRVISRTSPEENRTVYENNIRLLKQNMYLSETLVLEMPVYDVDFAEGERDDVYLNEHRLEKQLWGKNDEWFIYKVKVPIEYLKFGKLTDNGNQPATPSDNIISIDVDTTNKGWCTSVAWVSLSFEAMSPIVFVHGNGSNGGFLDRLEGIKDGYKNNALLLEDTLNMIPKSNFVNANKIKVAEHMDKVARAYGVDSIHIIAHSKGGLDVRAYLADEYQAKNQKPKVLSLTTLSTPHNGSILADEAIADEAAAKTATSIYWNNFPNYTQEAIVFNRLSVNDGHRNLTTDFARDFNNTNLSKIARLTSYNTIGADADLDFDQKVCSKIPGRIQTATCNQYNPIAEDNSLLSEALVDIIEVPNWFSSFGLPNVMYQNLRGISKVEMSTNTLFTVPIYGPVQTVTMTGTVTNPGLQNDVLVTVPSAHGDGTFGNLVPSGNKKTFTGVNGANHATIGARGFADIISWQSWQETQNGDLKSR